MPHIVSTLPTDMLYTLWQPSATGAPHVKVDQVLVKGGHGVAQRDSTGGLHTPRGVVTHVTEKQLDLLKQDEVFKLLQKNNFVQIINSERPPAPAKVSEDMAPKDKSAPLDDSDFKKGGRAASPDGAKVSGKKLQ